MKNLMKLALKLTDKDIATLTKLKKSTGKITKLEKQRKKLEKALSRLIAKIELVSKGKIKRRKGRKAGVKAVAKKVTRGKKRKSGLTKAVRQVIQAAKSPINAATICKALPGVGYKVKDESKTKKNISVVLAGGKDFKKTGKGLYMAK